MPVARTYEKYEQLDEPFVESGKMYVHVKGPHGSKKVRWYTDAERARMDKAAGVTPKPKDIMNFNAKHAFGFDELGYITIYKGDVDEIEKWADSHHECVRRNLTFGIYTPSRLTIKDLPATITPVRLKWDDISDGDTRMKPHDDVAQIVNKMTIDVKVSKSIFQGNKDNWIERVVTIKSNKVVASRFGEQHVHTMLDADENVYIWETSTRDIPVGSTVRMKMKVKDHKTLKGVQTTIVYYCKVM